MARVRVYLLTYHRPHLLRRALRSLLQQSLSDWVCELHNDAPEDDVPRMILAEIAPDDARFQYHPHARNWGPVATFNHAFAGGSELYASILEDDNWWEPEFLQSSIDILESKPDAALVWTNMRVWQEEADGRWTNTGRTIWPTTGSTASVAEFHWPELLQAFDALHSNGATVFRPRRFRTPDVPPTTPFAIIEQARERAALGPMLFQPRVLANFACTLHTARGDNRRQWLQAKLLVAASFFHSVSVGDAELAQTWQARRALRPCDTDLFFLVALALKNMQFVQSARSGDWLRFLLGAIRHPFRLVRGLRFRRDHAEVWSWFLTQTTTGMKRNVRTTIFSKQSFPGTDS